MRNILQEMKNIDIIGKSVTIKSTMKEDTKLQLEELANNILGGE